MLIGMSAAVAQGVMHATLDVDLWIDLPARQYLRVQNLARSLGATVAANTVVYLEDGTPVNFIFAVTGLGSFRSERRFARRLRFRDVMIPVLSLERIARSKAAIRREKDLLHLKLIEDFLRCRAATARPAQRRPRARKTAS
jgi:hypothetical protein